MGKKAGKDKPDKKGKKDKGANSGDGAIRVAAHPGAVASIRRTRSWAGLAGFAIVALLAYNAGVPHAEALLRGLIGGLVAWLGAWGFSIALWKRLIVAELEARRPQPAGSTSQP